MSNPITIIEVAADPTVAAKSANLTLEIGTLWRNSSTGSLFMCVDAGAGTWVNLYPGPSSISGSDGLDFNPVADGDVDLITVGVTGTPKLSWDESEDAFALTKPLFVGGTEVSGAGTDNWLVNAIDNAIESGTVVGTIGGGGTAERPNLIGSATAPTDTPDPLLTDWAADSGYVANAAGVATISGGYDNINNQEAGTIVGGGHNFIKYNASGHSVIIGGSYNLISGARCVIAGSHRSTITGASISSAVVGGWSNDIVGNYSAIVGGKDCIITGADGVIAGTLTGTITGHYSAILAGLTSTIVGNYCGILGGASCSITGDYSYAFGKRAIVTAAGAVQWNDHVDADATNATQGLFAARFAAGYYFNGGTAGAKFTGAVAVANLAEGATACITRKCVRELVTLTGATKVTSLAIPVGALLIGAQFCVNTTITDTTGNDTWGASFSGGSTTALVPAGCNPAQNVKRNYLLVPEVTATNPTEITFTPNAGEFSAGVVEVLVYYDELTPMANA